LNDFTNVLWLDTSVILKQNKLEPMLSIAKTTGIFGNLIWFTQKCSTSQNMFDYFQISHHNKFGSVPQMEAGIVLYSRNLLNKLIMKAWVTCALDAKCMIDGCRSCKCCSKDACHRFDQSALTMIAAYFFRYPTARHISPAHANRVRSFYKVVRRKNLSKTRIASTSKF
jgi:hypothetical protein